MNTDTPLKLTNPPTNMWLPIMADFRDWRPCTEGKELKWREATPKGDWHGLIELLHETIARIDAEYDRLSK